MSAEILVPFALDVNGSIAQTTNADVQQAQHVSSLTTTQPGERVMRPRYGVPTMKYLFANGAGVIAQRLTKDVTQAMAQWEPGITVNSVTPVPNNNGGVAEVQVDYLAAPVDTGQVQTATVAVGGSVSVS